MAVQSFDMDGEDVIKKPKSRRASSLNIYKTTAVIAQLLSYLTTLWFVEWVWPDGQPMHRYAVALVIEALLVAMKFTLFDGSGDNDGIGWAGFVIDALTNLGGALPRASAVVTFPAFAILLQVSGLYAGATTTMATIQGNAITYGGLAVGLVSAILLAVAPHKLWKRGGG
jgi:hypothetical protein